VAFAPLVLAITIGLGIGFARRGRLSAVGGLNIASAPLLGIAVVMGLAVDQLPLPAPSVWAAVALSAALAFAVRNLMVVGMAVVGIGITANLIPIIVNGATPVRADALVEAGMIAASEVDRVTVSGPRLLATSDTAFAWLGDTLPLGLADQVISFGDLIILVGLIDVIANAMMRRERGSLSLSARASLEAFGWHEAEIAEGNVIELRNDLRPVYPAEDIESVRIMASTSASPVQDWGMAPAPVAESPSQYSAKLDLIAPSIVRDRNSFPTPASSASLPRALKSA